MAHNRRFRVGLPNISSNTFVGVGNDGSLATPPYALTAPEAAAIIQPYINFGVDNFIAAGDTSYDQAINRAILAANAQGGGNVIIQNNGAIYNIANTIILRSNVRLYGQGRPTLRLSNNVNVTMIEGLNYATLRGTLTASGTVDNWSVENIVLDGNSGNNTFAGANSGHGLAVYGRNFYVRDLYIANTAHRGATLEYTSGANGVSPFNGRIDGITTSVTGTEGLVVDVSDCHIDNINIRSPSQQNDNTYDGFLLLSAAHVGGRVNIWRGGSTANTHRYGINVDTGAATTRIAGAVIETGKTGNLYLAGDSSQVTVRSYNALGDYHAVLNAKYCNLELSMFQGPIGNTSYGLKLGQDFTAVGNIVRLSSSGTANGMIDFFNSGGANHISGATNFAGTENLYANTPNPADDVTLISTAPTVTDRKSFKKLPMDLNNFVAFGTNSTNATALRSALTKIVSNDATGNNGVKLTQVVGGSEFVVCNVNFVNNVAIWVYPHSAGKFVGLSANQGLQIPVGATWVFYNTGFDWGVLKSA